jgi:hypothetical protein
MVGRSTNRRADSSVEHMSKGGIPVNPAALKAVRDLVESGEWKKDPAGLLEAVKSDPGLFVYVAKNMKSLADEVREGVDPLAQLASLEQEKLVKLFHVSDRDVSTHRLRDATPAQMLRVQQAIISARAAEALGPKVDISADLAFSGAVLRQVGHSMIAWNYPDIYARALLHQRAKGANLDQELQKLVGMTPAQVGSRFAAEWNLSPELRWAVSGDSQRTPPHQIAPRGTEVDGKLNLRDVCDLSELFAKANDPLHYPDAPEKWAEAERAIEESVGVSLPDAIAGAVQKSLAFISQVTQHALQTPFFRLPEKPNALSAEQRALIEANPYLRRCSDEVKLHFVPVYRLITKEGVSVEAIRELVDSAIPHLGFVRGCLYLYKPETGTLKPALRVGDLPLSAYPTLGENEHHPVAESLQSTVLLKSPFGPLNSNPGTHLYCALLGEKHRGVLHLEVAPEHEENPAYQATLLFNAVRQCILDCLDK